MGAVLTPEIFRRRREILAEKIGEGALALTAAPPKSKSRDAEHPYCPDKYLYYLSGFAEPGAALLLDISGGKIRREILLCRPRAPHIEQWEGERAGPLRARRRFNFAESGEISGFSRLLNELLKRRQTIYSLPGADSVLDSQLCAAAAARRLQNRANGPAVHTLRDVAVHLDDMRTVKSGEELALMRRAAQISAAGHCAAMRARAKSENELEGILTSVFRANGGLHAFSPIVAAGKNACTLHYTANGGRIGGGALVLMDAGAEYQYYAGDMSRVFPAGGKFSPAQAAVYDAVLAAQRRALAAVRAGVRWAAVENAAARVLCRELIKLGICRGSAKTLFAKKTYRRFYMHGLGHFIGLDVHDAGRMREADGASRILRRGMVLTIEPGLYIPTDADIPPQYRGIGIRIEDAVAVGARGCEILAEAPKTRREIEQWMRG